MRLNEGEEIKKQKAQSPAKRQFWGRLAIIFGLAILYTLAFRPILKIAGPMGTSLISIPVALAGWYFGIYAGLIASFIGIILIAFLSVHIEGGNWLMWIVSKWPETLSVMVIGYVAGRAQKEMAKQAHTFDQLRLRERYLAMIGLAVKDILDPNNPENRYHDLVSHLRDLFLADFVHLVRWDVLQKSANFVVSTSPSKNSISDIKLDAGRVDFIVSMPENEHVLAFENLRDSQTVPLEHFAEFSPQPQSALYIPLIVRGHYWGAAIIAFGTVRHFFDEEIEYAELAGKQIALAFWTVEQEFNFQKKLKEANALANIERVLSETERVGIETVLQLIVDSAKELIPEAERAVLHLLDQEQQVLVPRAVSGYASKSNAKLNMHLGDGVAGQAMVTGKVIAIADTHTDPRFVNQSVPVKFRSLVVAPIQFNERVLGAISIQSEYPNAFTSDASNLLGALGTQAAIAIENANLLETTQQDLREINALYHISRELAASLEPDRLMKDVVNLLQQNFGYYHVQIFAVDPESGDFLARRGSGKIGDQLREQGYRLPVGAGIVGHVIETEQPFVTNNVDDVVFFIRNPLLSDTQSELTVPIKIENQVVGALDIHHAYPGYLTQRDMQLMTVVADQLAVALQKANFYAELQTSLSQEKAMRSQLIQSERLAVVGRLLASVSHELNNPLQAIQNALFLIKEEEKLSPQGRQDLEIILSETERMTILLERLRTTFRPTRTEDLQNVQINNIVENIATLTATHMRHKRISFEFYPDPELPSVPAIPDQIRQVVLNLFMNAVEAMQPGGNLSVQTQQLADEDKVLLSVADTGPGIDSEVLPHIFEPFVSNKETGTGLGLTITYDIIRQHGGDITAENNPQGGATFKVLLPIRKKG